MLNSMPTVSVLRTPAWLLVWASFSSLVRVAYCAPVFPVSVKKKVPKQTTHSHRKGMTSYKSSLSSQNCVTLLTTDLFLQALAHRPVHIVACAKELQDIVLRSKHNLDSFIFCLSEGQINTRMKKRLYLFVALPQTTNQFITFIRVQVRWKVRVHAELRAYCRTAAVLKATNNRSTDNRLLMNVDLDTVVICVVSIAISLHFGKKGQSAPEFPKVAFFFNSHIQNVK